MFRPRATPIVGLVALGGFAGITIGLAAGILTGLDQSIASAIAGHRLTALYWPARAGFSLGQNWAFPAPSAVVALLLSVRRRTARPFLGMVVVWLVHTLVVGAVKLWAGRPAPVTGDPHLHAVAADLNRHMSFPSGHAANIVVFSATLGLLLAALTDDERWVRRLRVVGATCAAICVACMIYLGFHWTTDALGGLLLGVAIRLLVVPFFLRTWNTE